LRELVFKVWPQTYRGMITDEQIEYMLDLMYSESSLLKQMRDGARFIFIDNDGEPVGYASFQQVGPGLFKLHKIYVLPGQQGKGTGKYMIEYIIEEVKKQGATSLQLQVNRRNRAKNFYEKLGFSVIQSCDFDIGNGYVMDDYVMEKKL
jgi:ribosomal protein S18 acetylase RimI-like enzyme